MIDINYTLHRADGDIVYEEHPRSEHVPRVGELVTFDFEHSYQVIDVLWHLSYNPRQITVTAHELDWHEHIKDATTAWEQRRRQR